MLKSKTFLSFIKPANKQLPESVPEIFKIDEADGVIIGTPEYDHSIPAVLMNFSLGISVSLF